jgi:hypothetical protein
VRRFHPPCDADRSTDDVLLFVLSGQSNMDGYGLLSEIDPEFAEPYPDVELYWEATRAVGPLVPAGAGADRAGPEVSFGRDIAAAFPNQRVMLMKYSVGGTNLYQQWYPGNDADDAGRGPLYRVWQGAIANAFSIIRERGLEPRVGGMIWMQGESDGFGDGEALAYETNLTRFIRRTRDDLGVESTTPFAIGRIFAPTVPLREVIQRAQTATAQAMFGASWVDTDDLGLTDSIHYDGPGQVSLGRRLAAGVINAPPLRPRELAPEADWSERIEEFSDYELALRLDVPLGPSWYIPTDVVYETDRREEIGDRSFERVAYLVELDGRDRERRWVWVSMEPFAPTVASFGVPTDEVWEGPLSNVNVRSSDVEAVDGVEGRIEFWSDCYSPGADGVYDAVDDHWTTDCYGSMQIHAQLPDLGLSPVFALNRWLYGDGSDIGIGAWGGRHPDWTFSQAGSAWETRRISVFVR